MHETTLPVDVCELLDSCIDSVDALDALLLLLADPARSWSVPELANALDVRTADAARALACLRLRGLADGRVEDGAPIDSAATTYRLATLEPFSRAAFGALARACSTERSAVVAHVSRRSLARIGILAEAFTRGRG